MTDRQLPKSVLARGALLLRACGDAESALSLAELAQRSGLPTPLAGGGVPL
ncbi:helix-turn-helix domain-containing protein [Streptomyces sp. NPDC048281]|uniref:helix-turn-helix domain-containing protein n=1 Tax=Streptomyces sp. NPDC048281 TaxID=3154715 RepID=UPI00343DA1C6